MKKLILDYHVRLDSFIESKGGITEVSRKVLLPDTTFRTMFTRGTKLSDKIVTLLEDAYDDYDDYYIRRGKYRYESRVVELESELQKEKADRIKLEKICAMQDNILRLVPDEVFKINSTN